MSTDDNGALRGLSDQQAAARLEALGYNHYRVRSILVEARQAASVTLERHLITLMHDGFHIETLARQQEPEPERERSHYFGDDCDPPHVLTPEVPVIDPERDKAWREMVALGEEIQGEEPGRAVPAAEHEEWLPGSLPGMTPLERFRRQLTRPSWAPHPPVPPGYQPFGTPSPQDPAPPREWPAGLHEIHCRDDRCSLGCDCPCHRGDPVPPLASGLDADAATGTLRTLGYGEALARAAVGTAAGTSGGFFRLERHVVEADTPAGPFAVRTIVVVTPEMAREFMDQAMAEVRLSSPEVSEDLAAEMGDAVRQAGEQAFDEVLGGGPEATGIPMRHQAALNTLIAMGYTPSAANDALAQTGMTGDGMALLERHAVTRMNDGTYVIDLVDPLHGMGGHQLSDEQIRRHGRDRYPTAASNYAKVLDEAGELGEALMELYAQAHIHDDDGTVEGCPGCFAAPQEERVRREYADVGLALFALGRKLGLDLIACMHDLVAADTRDFRGEV
jgi:Holliday junction resolvasome RuvABC DNA-binding subunit